MKHYIYFFFFLGWSVAYAEVSNKEVVNTEIKSLESLGPKDILWDSTFVGKKISNYKKVVPIRFEAKNIGQDSVKIISVSADCSVCVNPKASVDVVSPGQTFFVHAMIILNSVEGVQKGSIVVATQVLANEGSVGGAVKTGEIGVTGVTGEDGKPLQGDILYKLAYEVTFDSPVTIKPYGLKWGPQDQESKEIVLTLDFLGGYKYKGFKLDPSLYAIAVGSKDNNKVVLYLTPLSVPAPTTNFEVSYSVGDNSKATTTTTTTVFVPLGVH